jgi:hypothetical protein
VKLKWKAFGDWSIRYKLLLLLVTLGVATFAATGTIAYLKYLQALKQNVMNQLTGVNRGKARQLESYYQIIHNHVLTLSESRMFIDAVRAFGAAYRKLNVTAIPAEAFESVIENYRARFYPEMQKMKMARPHVEDYLLVTPAAYHLQYAYIAKTPRPPGGRARDRESRGRERLQRRPRQVPPVISENHREVRIRGPPADRLRERAGPIQRGQGARFRHQPAPRSLPGHATGQNRAAGRLHK